MGVVVVVWKRIPIPQEFYYLSYQDALIPVNQGIAAMVYGNPLGMGYI